MQFGHLNERGFSLLSVLVAVGVLGIVATSVSSIMGDSFKMQKKISIKDQKMQLARSVSRVINCSETIQNLPNNFCSSAESSKFSIYNSKSKILIEKSGSFIGNWLLTPTCSKNDDKVHINLKAALKTKRAHDAKFVLDPITKKPIDGNDPSHLLFSESVGGLCEGFPIEDVANNGNTLVNNLNNINISTGFGDENQNHKIVSIDRVGGNTVKTRRVHGTSLNGGGDKKLVCCNKEELRLSCYPSRHVNLQDNCSEKRCGIVGIKPVGTKCCAMNVDDKEERASFALWITCLAN